jgi:hypothetical protein
MTNNYFKKLFFLSLTLLFAFGGLDVFAADEEWSTYSDKKSYYFKINYPANWKVKEVVNNLPLGAKYEKKLVFRTREEGGLEKGFDVLIYDKKKTTLENTAPLIKRYANKKEGNFFEELKLESGRSAKKVSINSDNNFYREAYFYSFEDSYHIFNVVSTPENGYNYAEYNGEERVKEELPEFEEILNSFGFLARPPVITTKIPHGAKIIYVNGVKKYVCAKKNDKPSISKKNPPGHMDMQCCLDPDEVPNPWCTY